MVICSPLTITNHKLLQELHQLLLTETFENTSDVLVCAGGGAVLGVGAVAVVGPEAVDRLSDSRECSLNGALVSEDRDAGVLRVSGAGGGFRIPAKIGTATVSASPDFYVSRHGI